jgi:hypothetical protein
MAKKEKTKLVYSALGMIVLFILTHACTKQTPINSNTGLKIPPAGYESFSDCKFTESRYRVWAESKDSVYGFHIKALMVAWINDSTLTSTTTFKLSHRTGKTFTLEGEGISLLPFEEFRNFVNNNHKAHNDTIVDLCYEYDTPKSNLFNMEACCDKPFFFMDVTFDGRKALLIRKGPKETCNYFRVFSLGRKYETVKEINYEPYNHFKTSAGYYTYGGGTKVDYINKTITVYSNEPGSCSCHFNTIIDTYTLNREQGRFVKATQEVINQCEE